MSNKTKADLESELQQANERIKALEGNLEQEREKGAAHASENGRVAEEVAAAKARVEALQAEVERLKAAPPAAPESVGAGAGVGAAPAPDAAAGGGALAAPEADDMASRPRNGVSPAQRVAVLVDVQNMYYAAKNLYGGRVAYQRLFNHTLRRRGLVRAIAYIVSRPGSGQEAFFELLKAVGFELKIKEAAEMPDGSRKGNWDVGLALDAITLADRVDVIHLVSGDGDFTDLIYLVKSRGVRVEVSSFPESTSEQLIRAATQYYALNEEIIFGDTGPRMDGDGRPPRDRERGDRSGHRRDGRDRDRDAGPREPDAPREGRENADESAAPTPPAEPPTEDDDNRGNRLDEEPAWRAQPQFDASRPAPHEYTGSGRVIPERGKNFDSYQGQGGGYGGSRRHYGGGGGRYPRRGNSRGNPYDRGDDDRGNRR